MMVLLLLLSMPLLIASADPLAGRSSSSSDDDMSFMMLDSPFREECAPTHTINYSRVAIIAPSVKRSNILDEEDLLVVRDPRQGYIVLDGVDPYEIKYVSDFIKNLSPYEFSLYVAYHSVLLARDSNGEFHLEEDSE